MWFLELLCCYCCSPCPTEDPATDLRIFESWLPYFIVLSNSSFKIYFCFGENKSDIGTTSVLFSFREPKFLLFLECWFFKWSITSSCTSWGRSEMFMLDDGGYYYGTTGGGGTGFLGWL